MTDAARQVSCCTARHVCGDIRRAGGAARHRRRRRWRRIHIYYGQPGASMDLLASGQAGQVFAASCPAAFSSYRRIVFCISRSSHVSKKGEDRLARPSEFSYGGVSLTVPRQPRIHAVGAACMGNSPSSTSVTTTRARAWRSPVVDGRIARIWPVTARWQARSLKNASTSVPVWRMHRRGSMARNAWNSRQRSRRSASSMLCVG